MAALVDFPELVGVFGNEAINKDLPVPRSRIADMLDMKPDIRGAIAKQLVIPLRPRVELVSGLYIVEEKCSGSFRGRRQQPRRQGNLIGLLNRCVCASRPG